MVQQTSKQLLNYIVISFCAALLTVLKFIFMSIPNVHPVTMLIIIYVLLLGFKRSILIISIFILLEGLWWGFGLHFFQYMIVWPILVMLVVAFKPIISTSYLGFIGWAIFAGLFGMIFGTLSALPYLIIDKTFFLSYILGGLIYDAIHMISNYLIVLATGKIIYDALKRIFAQMDII